MREPDRRAVPLRAPASDVGAAAVEENLPPRTSGPGGSVSLELQNVATMRTYQNAPLKPNGPPVRGYSSPSDSLPTRQIPIYAQTAANRRRAVSAYGRPVRLQWRVLVRPHGCDVSEVLTKHSRPDRWSAAGDFPRRQPRRRHSLGPERNCAACPARAYHQILG